MLVRHAMLEVILQRALVAILARQQIIIEPCVMELRPVERVTQQRAMLLIRAHREVKVVEMRLVECVVLVMAVVSIEARVDTFLLVKFVRDVKARKEAVAQVKPPVVVDGCAQLLPRELCGHRRERRVIKVLVAFPVVVIVFLPAHRAEPTARQEVELVFVREERSVHGVCQVYAEDAFRARGALEVYVRAHVRLVVQQAAVDASRAGMEVHVRRTRLFVARKEVWTRLQILRVEYFRRH